MKRGSEKMIFEVEMSRCGQGGDGDGQGLSSSSQDVWLDVDVDVVGGGVEGRTARRR